LTLAVMDLTAPSPARWPWRTPLRAPGPPLPVRLAGGMLAAGAGILPLGVGP